MLFKRKPPVWQWDDRFSIHLHYDSGPASNFLFTYIIPYDHYAHLIAGSWYLYLANTGTPRQARCLAWRGHRYLYAVAFGQQRPADTHITEHFGGLGYPVSDLVAPPAIIRSMIPYCYLHPGDRITVELINPNVTDLFLSLHLTFKFWNV